jgi:hypothetical protein
MGCSMARSTLVPLLCMIWLAGCDGEAATRWSGVMRDSAGVTIVSNPDSGFLPPDLLPTAREELRIGRMDGPAELQFGAIVGAAVDGSGNIYVLDALARRVRVFDSDGRFLREMGGPGEGPGEMSSRVMLVMLGPGDTVLVADGGQRRVIRFTPDGNPAGSFLLPSTDGEPLRFASLPDGRIVQQARRLPTQDAPIIEERDRLLVRNTSGTVVDTLSLLPAGAGMRMSASGMQYFYFASEPFWQIDNRGRLIYGMNSEYRIEVHDAAGKLERVITKEHSPIPVSEKDRAGILEFMRQGMLRANRPPAEIDRTFRATAFAEFYPAYSYFVPGPRGTLWVQRVRTSAELADRPFNASEVRSPRWDLFDPQGRLAGTVTLPDGFVPLQTVGDGFIGMWRDEWDVQHIVRLRIAGLDAVAGAVSRAADSIPAGAHAPGT